MGDKVWTRVRTKSYVKPYVDKKKTAIERALLEMGFRIERDAKDMCTVDTGRLRASISTNWTNSGLNEGATGGEAKRGDGIKKPNPKYGKFTVVVGTNVFYGFFVEHGTQKMSAQPFIFPAYFTNEGEVIRRVGEILGKKVSL